MTKAKALLGIAHATWPITRPSSVEYRFGRHPTQKPERLLEVLLAVHDGLVLDFCAGACTTAVAAVRQRRPVMCGELNDGDGYLGTARLRVAAELGGSGEETDPLRELAEWLVVECNLLEPVSAAIENAALDWFRRALADGTQDAPRSNSTAALADAIRRAVDDTGLLSLALRLLTDGPDEELVADWSEALDRLAAESGDDFGSTGPSEPLAEARDYLAGFCTELGVDLGEPTTGAWLAGEALAEVLRKEWSR